MNINKVELNAILSSKIKESIDEIEKINKSRKTMENNLLGDLISRKNVKEKERTNEQEGTSRYNLLTDDINLLDRKIEAEKREIDNELHTKKVKVQTKALESIVEYLDKLSEISKNEIESSTNRLYEIKTLIDENNRNNNFEEISKLSDEALLLRSNIEKNNIVLNNINSLIEKVNAYDLNNISAIDNLASTLYSEAIVIENIVNTDTFSNINTSTNENANTTNSKITNNDTNTNADTNSDTNTNTNSDEEKTEKSEYQIARDLVENVKQTNDLEDLRAAHSAVSKLPNDHEKECLVKELENIKIRVLIKEAEKLVEEAEKTLKEEDALKAKEAVLNLVNSEEKEKLLNRVNALIKPINEEFTLLLEELIDKANRGQNINRIDVTELNNLYSKLSSEDLVKYESSVESIVDYYNNGVQEKQKDEFKENSVKKYGKLAFVTEFLGITLNKVLSSKLANKLRTMKIEKNSKKLKNESLSDKKKGSISKKIEKSSKNIADSSLVSGVRLFAARNKIASMKPVLYKAGLEEYDKQEFDSARSRLSKIINKNINKKSNDDAIKNNKDMMINVLDQYSEMLSICDDYREKYADALLALEEFKENLDEATYNAYREQFYMIACYRKHYNDEIYELKEKEIDNIKTYYDSEEYKKSNVKTHYIK